jgi:hypothetical protein
MKTLLPTMTLLASAAVLADSVPARLPPAVQVAGQPGPNHHEDPATHPHLGMWVTEDGHIRHELLPNGRYDEQRGSRKSAYQGRYWVLGDRIWYLDDTGFTADGQFRGEVFLHGGYVFRRVPAGQAR